MRYICGDCGELIDEGDYFAEGETCPECGGDNVTKSDGDSEYGN